MALFIALALSFAQAKVVDFVGDERGVQNFLMREEGWAVSDLAWNALPLGVPPAPVVRAYTAKFACGTGVCPQYLFKEQKGAKWRFIGFVSGRIEITTTVNNRHYNIRVVTEAGQAPENRLVEELKFDGKKYVGAP